MIEFGDCRETMRRWKEQGVKAQTCVTSPPYYGLRDYGHEGQIGLEETPEQYIKAMVEVFRCVWDVLADDGTLWLNIGDSYAAGKVGRGDQDRNTRNTDGRNTENATDTGAPMYAQRKLSNGLKQKDLIGIPWMLAFALRAEGWYLRQDIIWHKPNPMPESVQDRCTKAHEYIFLLSKSQKYHYDHEAIKEGDQEYTRKASPKKIATSGALPDGAGIHGGFGKDITTVGANKRSVWTVTTKPYKGAHFATFPSDLIEPCILAGAPAGGVVLDPFMGSGTTAAVAIANGRDYLGCELNPAYKELQDERIRDAHLGTAQMELI